LQPGYKKFGSQYTIKTGLLAPFLKPGQGHAMMFTVFQTGFTPATPVGMRSQAIGFRELRRRTVPSSTNEKSSSPVIPRADVLNRPEESALFSVISWM
jgi:hypothetical protein